MALAFVTFLSWKLSDSMALVVDHASVVSWEVEERSERSNALPVTPPRGRDRWKALRVLGSKRVELREARLLLAGMKNRGYSVKFTGENRA